MGELGSSEKTGERGVKGRDEVVEVGVAEPSLVEMSPPGEPAKLLTRDVSS